MAATSAERPPLLSRLFDAAVLLAGLLTAAGALVRTVDAGWTLPWLTLVTVPLIVVIARFPLLLYGGEGGIEFGFDSCVLIFLLCILPPAEAMTTWILGVVLTQLTGDARPNAKRFNIGLGIIGGLVAAVTITGIRGDELGSGREVLAVALAAAGYGATDFVLSAISVGLEAKVSARDAIHPGTFLALACVVPFDSLGYLAAIVVRSVTPWAVVLLAVPLVTMLVTTRAVTRGRENARRLSILFDAAARTHTLTEAHHVGDALIDDASRLLRLTKAALRSAPPDAHEIGARLRNGLDDPWLVAPVLHRDDATRAADRKALEAMAAVSSDTLDRLRLTREMTHLAQHDQLTGLPNRRLLSDRVEHALLVGRRHSRQIAVLFCDLDGFKRVNDRFGHAAGDDVLVDVAARMVECVRDCDTVTRLGGDEFAILLEDVHPAQVELVCERILAALRPGVCVAGRQLPLSTSIGVALDSGQENAEDLLRNADMAMYEAKTLGKDRYVYYESSLGRSRVERLEMTEALRTAIADRALSLVYQPVVNLETGSIVGVEALARWNLDGVAVPPDVFITVAEESGQIIALGDLILDLVGADARHLYEAGGALNIGVNISAEQLRSPAFIAKVEETIKRFRACPLVLEITERCFVDHDAVTLEAMAQLSARGVPFAIDDFGVGFSSIGYLQHMPIKIIKTDASFITGIDTDERSCRLLHSIGVMARALDIEMVVEGLERPEQLQHLRDHVHATNAQGYLLHRPMPLHEVVTVLRTYRPSCSSIHAQISAS